MNAEKTEKLIARALKALPEHRPSAGFSARVMASIVQAPEPLQARLARTAAIVMAAWTAAVAFLSAGAVYSGLVDAAVTAIEPGGLAAGLSVLSARLALAAGKAASALSFMADLAASAAGSPAYYEIAAAAAVCTLIVYSVAAPRLAAQKI